MVDWTNLNFPEPPVSAFGQLRPFDKYVIPKGENVGRLNAGQLSAYNAIIATLSPSYAGPTYFFLDGPGGTGKTFLYKALIQYFRNNGHVVVPSAWTGIAALFLPGGHTSHFFFKFPVPLMEDSICGLCRASVGDRRLIDAKLIIMDEAYICERQALMAMDRILRDLTEVRHRPFGGNILLLGGDFRQCAPVIPNAPAGSNIAESIRSSNLWSEFKLLHLTQNMRVGPGEQYFAGYLLTIGNGSVNVPDDILFHGSPQDLIHWVYENNLAQPNPNRALLCPRNDHCDYIYNLILDLLEGDQRVYFSEDKLIDPPAEAIADYPPIS
ncbi:ATP-dependent DNA helicase Pif1-like [Osmia lignaria lignaria]|uniref:ATP-dependent DNA helicase Pif1-like n=1 Tax=Osmia lignaria lignaria TaxID=1437193 RepID=UPI00402B8B8D